MMTNGRERVVGGDVAIAVSVTCEGCGEKTSFPEHVSKAMGMAGTPKLCPKCTRKRMVPITSVRIPR